MGDQMRALTQDEIDFLLDRGEFSESRYRWKMSKKERRKVDTLNHRLKNLGVIKMTRKGFNPGAGNQYEPADYELTRKGRRVYCLLARAYKILDGATELKESLLSFLSAHRV
jgi:hypothetical protein